MAVKDWDPRAILGDDVQICGVYWMGFPDGRFYIGSSKHMGTREKDHRARLRSGIHYNQKVQRAWRKFGEFTFRPLLICRQKDMFFYEQRCIDALKPQLNISPLAGQVGWDDTTKKKLSQTITGRKQSESVRARLSASALARGIRPPPKTAEQRSALSNRMKGNKYRLGRKLSDAEKENLRVKLKLLRGTPENREKVRKEMMGNKNGRRRMQEAENANV